MAAGSVGGRSGAGAAIANELEGTKRLKNALEARAATSARDAQTVMDGLGPAFRGSRDDGGSRLSRRAEAVLLDMVSEIRNSDDEEIANLEGAIEGLESVLHGTKPHDVRQLNAMISETSAQRSRVREHC